METKKYENLDSEELGTEEIELKTLFDIQNGVLVSFDCETANKYKITEVTIPDSVTLIGIWAFKDCSSLTSIVIPDSVTSLIGGAFIGCSSLTSIVIPNSVKKIGMWSFNGCSSLTSIVIPDSVTSIGTRAFNDCSSLTSIVIPNSVKKIGYRAFWGCSSLTLYFEKERNYFASSFIDDLISNVSDIYWANDWEYNKKHEPVPIIVQFK